MTGQGFITIYLELVAGLALNFFNNHVAEKQLTAR
jgi:hypothetical protein